MGSRRRDRSVTRRHVESLVELCGWPDRPGVSVPIGFLERMDALRDSIRGRSSMTGRPVDIDPIGELTLRARLNGWIRDGRRSVGGSCLLLDSSTDPVAVNLARPDDHSMVAAMLELPLRAERVRTPDLAGAVRSLDARVLVDMFADTGVPVAALGETRSTGSGGGSPVRIITVEPATEPASSPVDCSGDRPLVVDLSSLWAGPLCSRVLGLAGFDVVKIESTARPDGARRGNREFWDHLNDGKVIRSVDFASSADRSGLRELMHRADVVIEGSRPRALDQLGLGASELLDGGGPAIWLSITGHGRDPDNANRVGFGDDCAVAGGLVSHTPDGPTFFGDAVADPITGLVAASAVLEAWVSPAQSGRRSPVLLDVSLARVAAWAKAADQPDPHRRD